jgi:hypothetical protein
MANAVFYHESRGGTSFTVEPIDSGTEAARMDFQVEGDSSEGVTEILFVQLAPAEVAKLAYALLEWLFEQERGRYVDRFKLDGREAMLTMREPR